jgi:hypothetical protein
LTSKELPEALGVAPVAAKPCEGRFDGPSPWQRHDAFGRIQCMTVSTVQAENRTTLRINAMGLINVRRKADANHEYFVHGTTPNPLWFMSTTILAPRSRPVGAAHYVKLGRLSPPPLHHGGHVTFQKAELSVPRELFRKIQSALDDPRPRPAPARAGDFHGEIEMTGEGRLDGEKPGRMCLWIQPTDNDRAIWNAAAEKSFPGGAG